MEYSNGSSSEQIISIGLYIGRTYAVWVVRHPEIRKTVIDIRDPSRNLEKTLAD